MKVGYIKETNMMEFHIEKMRACGVDKVIVDSRNREKIPELLQTLKNGDELHVLAAQHLTRDFYQFANILKQLKEKGVSLYIDGALYHIDRHIDVAEKLSKQRKEAQE